MPGINWSQIDEWPWRVGIWSFNFMHSASVPLIINAIECTKCTFDCLYRHFKKQSYCSVLMHSTGSIFKPFSSWRCKWCELIAPPKMSGKRERTGCFNNGAAKFLEVWQLPNTSPCSRYSAMRWQYSYCSLVLTTEVLNHCTDPGVNFPWQCACIPLKLNFSCSCCCTCSDVPILS